MKSKPAEPQKELFRILLERLIDPSHPLAKLSASIEWSAFDESFGSLYSPGMGRPAKPTRLMVGLHYLKHAFNMSDEEVVGRWVENPYWQYFCGLEYFEHTVPIDASLMTKWRKRLGDQSITGEAIVQFIRRICFQRGTPERIFLDNGPEFIGKAWHDPFA